MFPRVIIFPSFFGTLSTLKPIMVICSNFCSFDIDLSLTIRIDTTLASTFVEGGIIFFRHYPF